MVVKGWTLGMDGRVYIARKGAATRRFDTRGARADWLSSL